MDEDKAQETINRGKRAAMLLESDVFQEATNGLKQQMMARWELSKDQHERDRIWHAVNMIEGIKSALGAYAADGSLEDRKLRELTTGRQKRFGIV